MKQLEPEDADQDDWISDNLQRATRFIDRYCRRAFFPEIETRRFPIPHRYIDLARRRFTAADINFDKDLLQIDTLTNGNDTVLTSDDFFLLEHNIYPKFGISLIFPNFWKVGYGGSAFNYDYPEVTINGWWGYHEQWSTNAWLSTYSATPTGGITAGQTAIEVVDASILDENGNKAFSPGGLLRIEDEMLSIRSVDYDTNILTTARGVQGSEAVEHLEALPITKFNVHQDITQVCLTITKLWREYGEAAGGRLGVSDVSAGVEIGIPADPLNVLKSYVRKI